MPIRTTQFRIKQCIVTALELDIDPETIADGAALFGPASDGGLELDSLAALEIVVAISKEFNLVLDTIPFEAFLSVASLTEYVTTQQERASG